MATATTATTTASPAIELENLSARPSQAAPSVTDSTQDILEASRVVDEGVPEGGYGWIALAACGIHPSLPTSPSIIASRLFPLLTGVLCWWFVGTTYCWGIIQGALVADGLSSPSTLAWVGSITVACNAIFSVLSARVLRSLGSRKTAFVGITFLAMGEILAGFSTKNIGGLFVTEGVVMGIGVSLSFIVVGSVPAQYFNRRRGLANGIVFASGGLGGAVISFLMDALIEKIGTQWTLRVLGFITLATGWPAAWFIRDRVPPNRRTFIDWALFKDSRFVVLFVAGAVATFPLLVR